MDEVSQERQHLDDLIRERDNIIQQFKISDDLSTVITAHYAHHLCVFDATSQTHTQTLENNGSMMLLYIAALTRSGPPGTHELTTRKKRSAT